MKRVFIYTRTQDAFYEEVVAYVESLGMTVVAEGEARKANLTIVLGGDGSVLGAARAGARNPILVINTGHLGFLTSSTKDGYKETITAVVEGRHSTTERHMLEIEDGEGEQYLALNDVVVSRPERFKMSRMAVYATEKGHPEELLGEYRSDGVIISTPTGSTAYNLSSQGPVIHPQCNVFAITPICPQGLTHRPIILPSYYSLRIKGAAGSEGNNLHMNIDGQITVPLNDGSIVIKYNSHVVETVNPDKSYFAVLREKLAWGIKPV